MHIHIYIRIHKCHLPRQASLSLHTKQTNLQGWIKCLMSSIPWGKSRKWQLSQKRAVCPQGGSTTWALLRFGASARSWGSALEHKAPSSLHSAIVSQLCLAAGSVLPAAVVPALIPCDPPVAEVSKVKLKMMEFLRMSTPQKSAAKKILANNLFLLWFFLSSCLQQNSKGKKLKKILLSLMQVNMPFGNTEYCSALSSWELVSMLNLKKKITSAEIT